MTRCLKLSASGIILLAAVLGLLICLREVEQLYSASQSSADQSTNIYRTTSRTQKSSLQQTSSKQQLLSSFYFNRSLSEAHEDALSLKDGQTNVLKQATNELHTPPVLTSQSIEDVEKFVFFIGYSRSGHSIIASIIDAHPNAILAHEFDIFGKLATDDKYLNKSYLFNALYRDSYKEAVTGWRSGNSTFRRKGYSLMLNSSESWQGKFRTLKVIGDKAGGHTSRFYRDQSAVFQRKYHSLVDTVLVPVHVIHVVRNPFDIIATRLLYRYSSVKGQKAQFNSTTKLKDVTRTNNIFNVLSSEVKAVHDMIKICNLTVLEIHNEDFILNPKKEVKKVCEFLGLSCFDRYLKMCEQAAYKSISRTRDAVEWSEKMERRVNRSILQFRSFQRYSLAGS